jgi:cytochrome c553
MLNSTSFRSATLLPATLASVALFIPAAYAADAVNGKSLYQMRCAVCHTSPTAKDVQKAANNPDQLRNAIQAVARMRFLFNVLSNSEIEDIAAYLGNPNAPAPAPSPSPAPPPPAPVTGPPPSDSIVIEYYIASLDHYFITGAASEQSVVDSGAVGPWVRTGTTFRTGGPTQVCRFYGNTAVNPATGAIFGPNSHFFTANEGECQGLVGAFAANAISWKFESRDFATSLPSGGQCAAGMVPVYRAYNNGFARGIASNHRITTSRTSINEVVAKGWIDEGIVMCAPAQ